LIETDDAGISSGSDHRAAMRLMDSDGRWQAAVIVAGMLPPLAGRTLRIRGARYNAAAAMTTGTI
jgi:hypothetical protein